MGGSDGNWAGKLITPGLKYALGFSLEFFPGSPPQEVKVVWKEFGASRRQKAQRTIRRRVEAMAAPDS